ncbi:MAG: SPOR domain-containing protein [Alphaproteobacteria bacterium]|nr:SPOR domain-containing protein [Alphaproteobacteria bacterium]
MNRLPQRELFSDLRPVRSDYAREINYARRRKVTLTIVGLVIAGICYAIFGGGPSAPSDIPTIKAEGDYKQKPEDPGGIDIPHQEVSIYDQLESKSSAVPKVEHLLPPPETPRDLAQAPKVDSQAPAPSAAPPTGVVTTIAERTETVPNLASDRIEQPETKPISSVPQSAPSEPPKSAPSEPQASPAPKKQKPSAPKAEAPLTIDKILQNVTSAEKPKNLALPIASNEKSAVQLASIPNEAEANAAMAKLQLKYAAVLGGAKLRVRRADLGSKGIYYRIQSDLLAKSEANRICSSLRKVNAGCILVGK